MAWGNQARLAELTLNSTCRPTVNRAAPAVGVLSDMRRNIHRVGLLDEIPCGHRSCYSVLGPTPSSGYRTLSDHPKLDRYSISVL